MTDATGLLPVLSFGLFVAAIHRRVELTSSRDWRLSFLAAAVVWGTIVVAITELPSAAGLLSRPLLFASWTGIAAGLGWIVLASRSRRDEGASTKHLGATRWLQDSRLDPLVFAPMAAIVCTLGILAVVAPPNTWDSMTYHMGRVVHWAQNGSVNHYPTAIDRQLYLGPWAEFAVLQFQELTGGDRWANLVQWMAMAASAVGASLIAQQLGSGPTIQLCAAALTTAIPMGILESTSTQTDFVTAFWLVAFVSFALSLIASDVRFRWRLTLLLGLSLGLATLTKATTEVFAAPFILWLIGWSLREERGRRMLVLAAIAVLALSINVPQFSRNMRAFGDIRGPRADRSHGGLLPPGSIDYYSNEVVTPAAVLSNVIRNLGLHLPTPLASVNAISLKAVAGMHRLIGFDMNDPRTSYMGGQPPNNFDIGKPRYHEDLAGNLVHAGLLILSTLIVLVMPGHPAARRRGYAIALVAGFLLFCAALKWQPWGSRLQLPLFVLGGPLIATALARVLPVNGVRLVTVLVMIASLPWVLFNESRMLVPRPSRSVLWDRDAHTVFNTSRREMYFRNRPELAEPYEAAAAKVEAAGCHEVGLVVGSDDWEYPFWVLLNGSGGPPTHLSHDMPGAAEDETPRYCAVIVTDGLDIDPAVVPALRTRYQTEWSSTPFVTVFLAPRSPVGSAPAASR